MKPTIHGLSQLFDRFNLTIFGGRLPSVAIELSDSAHTLGQCVVKRTRMNDGTIASTYRIRITGRVEMPDRQLEDVMIHEMIHLFIAYNGLIDTAPHGAAFRGLMTAINNAHGRNISISARLTEQQRESAARTKSKWHVIAVIYFKNGQCGVKSLPRSAEKVATYCRSVKRASNVRNLELYVHDNPYFNRFPTSTAMRCQIVDPETLKEALRGAKKSDNLAMIAEMPDLK